MSDWESADGAAEGLSPDLDGFGLRRQKRKWWHVALTFSGVVLCAVLGVVFGSCSFEDIEKMRQLERTPQMPISSVITGETNIQGTALELDGLVRSPDTHTMSLYYHYRIEEERRDSDGDTRWETIHTSSQAVDFRLVDDTGEVVVAATDWQVSISAEQKSRRRSGNRRYTERRIDPGDEIFVFGYAEPGDEVYRVGFEREGSYYPLISWQTESEQRQQRAVNSALSVLASVGFWLFAVFFLLQLFRLHHTALHLGFATTVVVIVLGGQGLVMMTGDLDSGEEAALRALEEGQRVIEEIFEERGVEWQGLEQAESLDQKRYAALTDSERERVSGVRMRMALSVKRTNANLTRFPEIIVGPLIGVHPIPEVDLPAEEMAQAQALESDYRPARLGVGWALIGIVVGLLGTILGTLTGLKKIKLKRTIENVPTSPAAGAVFGMTEIKGRVEGRQCDAVLAGPLTGCPCVYYRYLVQEHRGSGKNSRWVTITDDTAEVPFYCRDESGRILVNPRGAKYIPARRRVDSRGRMRYSEWVIAPGEPIYALGAATIDPDKHDELILSEDDETPLLLTSFTEEELMLKKAYRGLLALNFGILATMAAAIAVAAMVVSFGPMLYVTAAAISCSYLLAVLVMLYYNDLIFLRERVDRAWSNIDVALKKRFDLIGNLNEVVQEFLGHERQLQEAVTRARNARQSADHRSPDETELAAGAQARRQLTARVEAYPELKSQEVVERLMRALAEVEDEIALMRQGYNDSVERYNTRIDHFPEVFIARLFRFERADHLAVAVAVQEPPQVS